MLEKSAEIITLAQSGFGNKSVVVIGDCMLDRYAWGTVGRISPEAPVPVVHQSRQTSTGGGAANVALNLAQLGLDVHLAGFTGDDEAGTELRSILDGSEIDTSGLIALSDRPTITKTRVMGGHQQMLRIDNEDLSLVSDPDSTRLLGAFDQLLNVHQPDIILLSDYAKGALSEDICQSIIAGARSRKIPVIIDPKGDDFGKYQGATTLSPNRGELAMGVPVSGDDLSALFQAAQKMVKDLSLDFMVVTLGDEGIALVESDHTQQIPAIAQDVFDVSGAGDTVIATLAAALANGVSRIDAVSLANIAGGIVVGKVGTAPIRSTELANAITYRTQSAMDTKIVDVGALLEDVTRWKNLGDKVVFTNGCFDLLHPGHVAYLGAARALGDHLIVGLNTDRSVTALKGADRPVMGEDDRSEVLAGLTSVDRITLFDEDTPLNLILAIQPDILAKGADYAKRDIVGGKEVEANGGEVALIPLVEGRSTSRIIQRMQSGHPKGDTSDR